MYSKVGLLGGVLLIVASCATVQHPPTAQDAPHSQAEQRAAQQVAAEPQEKSLKHRIGIGRFTNTTRYGRALLGDELDPLGRQTSDMLARRLTESGRFLVIELPDMGLVEMEQARAGEDSAIPSVDVLVIGSLTEFGRRETGESGFWSETRMQTAYAKVDVRVVDVRTGHAFYSASGAGEASLEAGSIAGFGNRASYDSTLNDRAIGAAIDDLLNEMVARLEDRPWRTYIIHGDGQTVLIEGGPSQGLEVGDKLVVKERGDTVASQQTGFPIELPGRAVAELEVTGHFNEHTTGESSTSTIISGEIDDSSYDNYYVESK